MKKKKGCELSKTELSLKCLYNILAQLPKKKIQAYLLEVELLKPPVCPFLFYVLSVSILHDVVRTVRKGLKVKRSFVWEKNG